MPMARVPATSRRVRMMWRARDLFRGVYRRLSSTWSREQIVALIKFTYSSHTW